MLLELAPRHSLLRCCHDQLAVLQSNAKQRAETEQAQATAIKAHTLAETSYKAGLSNYVHVLVTHETILRQKEMIARLQADRLDAYAGLMRALGGGTVDNAEAITATQTEAIQHKVSP